MRLIKVDVRENTGKNTLYLPLNCITAIESRDEESCLVHIIDQGIWTVLMSAEKLVKKIQKLEER